MYAKCSRMSQNVCRMFQNVPECMKNIQNVLACSRQYAECVRMFQNVCRMHADPWVCLQLHMLACRSMSLHAVSFYVWAEQLTRISQCFFLQDQWEKLLAVSICCCMIYVCYKELAIAGCKWFWCYLMQLLDEVGFPTPISNEVCDGIMRPGARPSTDRSRTQSGTRRQWSWQPAQ